MNFSKEVANSLKGEKGCIRNEEIVVERIFGRSERKSVTIIR